MKVLIVRLSAIGDVVQGIPCLVALKESFPDWEISWLVEETCAPILKDHPYLKHLFVLNRNWHKKKGTLSPTDIFTSVRHMWNLGRCLQHENFDIAIDLQGLFKSGFWTWFSGASRRIGHNKTREFAHHFLTEFASERPTFDPSFPLIQRYLEPARYLGADVTRGRYILPKTPEETVREARALLGHKTLPFPTIAVCPWSIWPSKNWPINYWKDLAIALSKDFRVLLIGTNENLIEAHWLASHTPTILNLVGKTPISLLPEIFRSCQVVIGPDSGPLHLANATGVPRILMLFGSTSSRRSGPLGKEHRSLSLNLVCQPCFERTCPLVHHNCLQLLNPNFVLQATLDLIRRPNLSISPQIHTKDLTTLCE